MVLPSTHFVIVPNEVATQSDNSCYYEMLNPCGDEYVIESRMPHTGAVMLSGADKRVVSFVNRTFDTPTLLHPLYLLQYDGEKIAMMANISNLPISISTIMVSLATSGKSA